MTKKKIKNGTAKEVETKNEEKIETIKCTEYLACTLSDIELIEKSKELARATEELQAAEDRKKDLMADITAQVKKHEASIGALARIVSQGREYRNVPCEMITNFTSGIKTIVRLDTLETIKTMVIDQKDRQETLV